MQTGNSFMLPVSGGKLPEAGSTSKGTDMIFYFSGTGNSLAAAKRLLLPGEQLVNMAGRRRYVNPVLK